MAHARQQIRESVATIVGSLTTTGTNVFQSRVYNVQETELPCLLIYTTDEEVSGPQSIASPRRIERVLELVIEGKARASATLDDTLDDIAAEVEVAMGADPTLNVNAVDSLLSSVAIEYSADAEQPVGSIVMRYSVAYITTENNPSVLL